MSEAEDSGENALTAGERLRAAREGLGLSIDDVATSTRIPTRHLSSLETGDFSKLPAPTYSIGFAKSYAGAVGLDRNEIGEQLRGELGGSTRVHANQADQFQPLDPARAMPKWLIFAAIAAILVVVLVASWLSSRSLNAPDVVAEESVADPGLTVPPPPPPASSATGPVVLTATEQTWIQVKDGTTLLREGVLEPGQTFTVPQSATAPTLTTAKAEGLRITVGSAAAPQVGPAATRLSNISLLGPALLEGSARSTAQSTAAQNANAPPVRPASRPISPPVQRPIVLPPAPEPTAATNSDRSAAPTQ